jgi:flagellar hook-basal body complex protein FliE
MQFQGGPAAVPGQGRQNAGGNTPGKEVSDTMVLNPIGPLQGGDGVGRTDGAGEKKQELTGENFKKFLLDSLAQVNEMQAESEAAQEALATGQTDDVSQVMSAVEKADIAFNTLMAVRNKLVEAYQEVLRMNI